MLRINTINAILNCFGEGKAGFGAGNPTTGTKATYLSADWCNSIQEEIANVVEASGTELDPPDRTQLLTAIMAMITANIPEADTSLRPGDIIVTTRRNPPDGSLKANGAAVAIASYEDLAAAIYCGDTLNALAPWGYRCTNPATPSTTRSIAGTHIVLPDLRGEFLRGWDDGRGADVQVMTGTTTTGSTAITTLSDTQTLYVGQSITGTGIPAGTTIAAITSSTAITISAAATATASSVSLTFVGRAFGSRQAGINGSHQHTIPWGTDPSAVASDHAPWGLNAAYAAKYGASAAGVDNDNVWMMTEPVGGLEPRPRNVALLVCLKY